MEPTDYDDRFFDDCEAISLETNQYDGDVVLWDPDGRIVSSRGSLEVDLTLFAFTAPDRVTPAVLVPMDREDQIHEAIEVYQGYDPETHVLSEQAIRDVDGDTRYNELLNAPVTHDWTTLVDSFTWSPDEDDEVAGVIKAIAEATDTPMP